MSSAEIFTQSAKNYSCGLSETLSTYINLGNISLVHFYIKKKNEINM